MVRLCFILISLASPPSEDCQHLVHEGWASRYSANVMEATVHVRQHELKQLPLDVSQYEGFVAVLDCARIGDTVWIRPRKSGYYKPFLVADCAVRSGADGTIDWMETNNILVELDYPTAKEWDGLRGNLPVEVIFDCDSNCAPFWQIYEANTLALNVNLSWLQVMEFNSTLDRLSII